MTRLLDTICDVCELPLTDAGCGYCYRVELEAAGAFERPWRPTGIQVEALRRAAQEVELLVRVEELRAAAERARDDALTAHRLRLDLKWTWWR